jgi:hypothetical protein
MINEVFSFLESILNKTFNMEDEEILFLLEILYDIDFFQMLKNNDNRDLLQPLMEYGLKLSNISDMRLYQTCVDRNDITCISIYNKISSYKYYILGILNDLNIYRHFRYFEIPKYISSTARTFSSCPLPSITR